jgi:hypothetical protein
MALGARLFPRLAMKLNVKHRFRAFVDRTIKFHNIISKIWNHLAQRPANMGFDR